MDFPGIVTLIEAIPEILSRCKWFYAPLLRLYHENYEKKLAGAPVYYTGLNEPGHVPEFELQDNTFKPIKFII
jgi:hypothetical protein